MPSAREEVRIVPLGRTFTEEVPLGPTEKIPLSCHTSASGKGKLHGTPECRTLRATSNVEDIVLPFGDAVGRLCTQCGWALPTDSPILPLGAAVIDVDSLTVWLDREDRSEEDLEEEQDAAAALAAGEYPPIARAGNDDGEDEEEGSNDEEWERYDRARRIRARRHEHWRRLHTYLVRSNEAVAQFPFLAPWAADLQGRLSALLDGERCAFAALLQPTSLLEAAAVRVLPRPEYTPSPGFAGLGTEAGHTFHRAWFKWSHCATWSWRRLEDHDFAVSSVVRDAFGRRRKGLPEALEAFQRVTAEWIAQARTQVSVPTDTPWHLVGIRVPAITRTHPDEPNQDPLTLWEASVIATYQITFHRQAGTAALLVPHLIAEQLIAGSSPTMPVQHLGGNGCALPAEQLLAQWRPDPTGQTDRHQASEQD
ncbi:hypothetical protein ACFXDJ_02550 [Streptomyces sp. NPDC059443]|uniref:hypothetical protein n=1 Tax=unclassified Streptomyces TaxID=2593676 RepID=UPI00367A8359